VWQAVVSLSGVINMQNTNELTKWEKNPRKISPQKARILKKTMDKYGDISGVTYNNRLGRLVGGHQRCDTLENATISYVKQYEKPNEVGTIAIGFIEQNGECFFYREVDWDEETHSAAALAANNGAGEWDWLKLKEIVMDLEGLDWDMELTGFELPDIENMLFAGDNAATGGVDYSALQGESVDGVIDSMLDGTRKALQIEFQLEHYQEAQELVKFWREQGAYVGMMLIDKLRDEKNKIK
jgi:hypothetical protein